MIKGTLDGVLGNSFVEHKPGYGGPIHEWGYDHRQEEQAKRESGWYAASREHPEVGLMNPQEFEEWKKANGLPPTVRSTGALGGPVTPPETPWSIGGVKTMEWNYERDGQNPLAGFGPIGPYNPDTDESKVVPLDFLGGFMQDRNLAGSYGQPSNMPDYMYESIQRQYGNPKFGNYSIEDKKNVINWYNRMKV